MKTFFKGQRRAIVLMGVGLWLGIGLGWWFSRPQIQAIEPHGWSGAATLSSSQAFRGTQLPQMAYTPLTANTPTHTFQLQFSLHLGSPAPGFQLKAEDGSPVDLTAMVGKAVIINFWASWCGPCKEEMPVLEDLYQQYGDQGLVVLGVNDTPLDRMSDARQLVDELGLTYPVLYDEKGLVSELYQVISLPSSVFIDRKGIVQHIQIGQLGKTDWERYADMILNTIEP